MNPSPNPPSPSPSPSTNPTPNPNPNPPPQKPMDLVASALTHNSPTILQQALDFFANNSRRGLTPTILDRVLNLAVKRAKPDLVRYLLDDDNDGGSGSGCSVEKVRPWSVGVAVRGGGEEEGEGEGKEGHEGEEGEEGKERGEEGNGEGKGKEGDVIKVLDVLVERGWDVNGRYTDSPDPRYPEYLIYQICHSEPLVRWCLNHGAHVCYPDVESHAPLLDSVARSGNLAIFKSLLDHGAKLGRRTLHLAVCSAAAACGAGEEELDRKVELVRFLVEELGVDVNCMDVDVEKGERLGNHYGTPLNYVAHASGNGSVGEERVLRYLLEKGANPAIKDCWDICDAFGYAKLGNKKLLEILDEWKQQQQTEKKEGS